MIKTHTLSFQNPSVEDVTNKEWIITNGLGGYASSTVCNLNTRKYHGLLVASFNPPTDRRVIVAKVEETIQFNSTLINLSSNQYPEVVHPDGYSNLKEFSRDPFPRFVYQRENISIEKEICMIYGANATVVKYTNKSDHPYELTVNPFFIERDFHGVSRKSDIYNFYFKEEEENLKIFHKSSSDPLYFKFTNGKFTKQRTWFYDFQYLVEKDRGMDYYEDLYSIGYVQFHIKPNESQYLIFSMEDLYLSDTPEEYFEKEKIRQSKLIPDNISDIWVKDLIKAGNQFIVNRESTNSYSIIAGYHWFSDWGRDTMIALRGLCIALDKKDEAKSILQTFLAYLSEGMLPNRFPDYNEEVEYNTIDATLWLFIAVYDYYHKFTDTEFIKTVLPKLENIIEWHKKGTRYKIHLTDHGLISGGDSNTQLTWMDARCDGKAITPRQGCAVEINALWFNALNILKFLKREINANSSSDQIDILINKSESSFRKYFINKKGYLNDVVDPDKGFFDDSIRPNQLWAISLPFGLLNNEEEKHVLEIVEKELFTPYGLRTLNPSHPNFQAKYEGDAFSRDSSYHQGTVWPFILGEFYTAYLRINNYKPKAIKFVENNLVQLQKHFYDNSCIYGISEIFDGLHPNDGKGAIHQAWSVSSIIKVIIENRLFQ